jgi:hypothetical protein
MNYGWYWQRVHGDYPKNLSCFTSALWFDRIAYLEFADWGTNPQKTKDCHFEIESPPRENGTSVLRGPGKGDGGITMRDRVLSGGVTIGVDTTRSTGTVGANSQHGFDVSGTVGSCASLIRKTRAVNLQ